MKKATIKKVDDVSWLVIDQQRGNVGVLYQNIQGDFEYLSSGIKEKFKTEKKVEKYFGARVFQQKTVASCHFYHAECISRPIFERKVILANCNSLT